MSEQQTTVNLTEKELKKFKKMSRPLWKKKRFIGPVAIIALIVIAVASQSGSTSGSAATTSGTTSGTASTSASSTSSSSTSTSTKANTAYKVGQTFKVGEFQYTVNSVKTAKTIGDVADGLGDKANGTFYIVSVTAKNLDSTASTVDTDMFKIMKDGNEYSASTSATTDANDVNNDMFLNQLNPNVSMTGNVVFDVPANLTSGLQLQLSGGMMSTDTGSVQLN